jgi:hypothetical protein
MVSRWCFYVISTLPRGRSIAGTDTPPWWLVHRLEQRDKGHKLAFNRYLGVLPGSEMLVSVFSGPVLHLVGQRGRAGPAGAAPSWVGASGTAPL